MMKRHTSSSSLSKGFSESRVYEVFEPEEINVPVRIRSLDREERFSLLHIAVSMNSLPGTHHQVLVIEVTDETDPFFLFVLECGETEFHALKQEQAILVDFLTFPHKLIELLQMCTKKLEDSPKFICALDKGHGFEATLNICENNLFRQITHLSLKLRSGSDDIVKKHLAAKLKEFKTANELLESENNRKDDLIEVLKAENLDLIKMNETMKSELDRRMEEINLSNLEKMNTIKQHELEKQQKLTSSFDAEKRYLNEKYEKQVQELTNKLETTQNKLNDVSSGKYVVETREREMSLKLSQLEHEIEMANNELQHLRKTNKSLDTSKFEQEKIITEYKIKLQSVERQLQDKEELNQKLSTMLQTNSEFKGHQDDTMSMLKATVSKLEDKLQQSANEINKGNSIIQKLQSDLKAGKQKLKLKNTVVLQQENVIQQKQEHIDSLDKQIYQNKREMDKKDENARDLERLVMDLKNKLEENQKALDSNVQTIQYLNNRINEVEKVRMPYTSTYKPATNPSPIAFRPSTYSMEHLKTTPRTPSYSTIPDADPFPKLLEPIKYKEPNP